MLLGEYIPLSGVNGPDMRFPECLGSRPDNDERCDTWTSWKDAMWTDVWRNFVGGHVREGPYNALFQLVHLCPDRGGWAETVSWSSLK